MIFVALKDSSSIDEKLLANAVGNMVHAVGTERDESPKHRRWGEDASQMIGDKVVGGIEFDCVSYT